MFAAHLATCIQVCGAGAGAGCAGRSWATTTRASHTSSASAAGLRSPVSGASSPRHGVTASRRVRAKRRRLQHSHIRRQVDASVAAPHSLPAPRSLRRSARRPYLDLERLQLRPRAPLWPCALRNWHAMFQFFPAPLAPSGVAVAARTEDASEIERFRARSRKLCRLQRVQPPQQQQAEALDVENGRTRKIPAKWRHEQSNQQDSDWLADADAVALNAFDFSASPEAFVELPPLHDAPGGRCSCATNGPATPTDAPRGDSLWQRRLQAAPTPSLGRDALWAAPPTRAAYDPQLHGYRQPQYFA